MIDRKRDTPPVPELSKADEHILAVLRERYGIEAIQQALPAAQKTKRSSGRPPNQYKDFEDAHLADWIDDRIAENRSVKQARIDAYEMQFGGDEMQFGGDADDEDAEKKRGKPPKVTSFLDRVKKKHLRGRALLRRWRGGGQ